MRAKAPHKDLSDAFVDLRHAVVEAEEEGFALPSDLVLSNAGRLLREMYEIAPQRFEVYPTPDAEIAIRALAPRRSVILLCKPEGGAVCFVNLKSGRRRQSYTPKDVLPDNFLKQALLDLKAEGS